TGRRGRAHGHRFLQLPPGSHGPHLRDHDRRRRPRPHRVHGLRRGARHAGAVRRARPRRRRLARGGPGDAGARLMATASTGEVSLWGLDPSRYTPHALHRSDPPRTYLETTCYADALIELVHARGDEPLAMFGFILATDWEGDQFT